MLTPTDNLVLDIADRHYRHPGARTEAIRAEMSMSEARYSQVLGALIERADAEAERPALVRRLRRLRDARRVQRAS